jgi:diaminopimelate decarboxylase
VRIELSASRATELAAAYGTPLYVYDLDVVAARVRALTQVLPPRFDLAFAVKANPSLGVLAHLASLGVGADVASGGELQAALRAGLPAERIVFTGPGKREDELARAVVAGLRAITVESLGELDRLSRLARARGRRIPVLLRASSGAHDDASIITAGFDKFGMLLDDLELAARRTTADPNLELLGLHAFSASNVRDASVLVEHARTTLVGAAGIARVVGAPVRLVDIGGGLGIPYADSESELDLQALGAGLAQVAADLADDEFLTDAQVLLEPGRFLLGPAGCYLSRVVDVKRAPQGMVAVIDGGIHHLVRPALLREEQRVRLLTDLDRPSAMVGIAGPLCTGLDHFAVTAQLPTPRPGDLLAVLDAGAYGFTESMPLFLSHPMPAEVALRAGEAVLLRPRLEPSELLDRQLLPPTELSTSESVPAESGAW